MSIMLNESNSSFDTTPSFDFVMRHDDGRDDEVVPDVGDEDEGFDLIDVENERREDIGVLIVPPTTGSSEGSRDTVLSIPDSVPTVLNSAMLDLPDCVHVVDNNPAAVRSNSVQSINEGNDNEPFSNRSRNEKVAANKNWRRNALTIVFLAAVSTRSVFHAFYMHRESILLREQIRILTDQAARSAATLDELKQEQSREVIFDNCWLHAHAKMSFGECSYEACKTVKENVQTFGSSVHNFWERMKSASQEKMTEGTKNYHGFYQSYPVHITMSMLRAPVNASWKDWEKVKVVNFTDKAHRMGDRYRDVWSKAKGSFDAIKFYVPAYTYAQNFHRFWVEVKGTYKNNMEDKLNDVGQSLYEAPSAIINMLKSGYNELIEPVYTTSNRSETSADRNESESLDNFVHNVYKLQSITKKVLVAAVWSAGAAILVNLFDMCWYQHGNFLALEN